MAPGTLPERRRRQRQVETAEHQIRDAEVNDEHSGSVPNLRTDKQIMFYWYRAYKYRYRDTVNITSCIFRTICIKDSTCFKLTLWRRIFFLILAHPVYKMRIIQEPNKLAL